MGLGLGLGLANLNHTPKPNLLSPILSRSAKSRGTHAIVCASAVPEAAPAAPQPHTKMKNGSSTALRAVKTRAHSSGVLVRRVKGW